MESPLKGGDLMRSVGPGGVIPPGAAHKNLGSAAEKQRRCETAAAKQLSDFELSLQIACQACHFSATSNYVRPWLQRRLNAYVHNERENYLLWFKGELQCLLRDTMANRKWKAERRNMIIPPWVTRVTHVVQWCKLRRSLPRLLTNDKKYIGELKTRLTVPNLEMEKAYFKHPERVFDVPGWLVPVEATQATKGDWVSGSATSTSTRKEGGFLNEVRKLEISDDFDDSTDESRLRDVWLDRHYKNDAIPCVIYELGLKVRLPTKNNFWFVPPSQCHKRALFSRYFENPKYPWWSQPLLDEALDEIPLGYFTRRTAKRLYIFSGDFSKATDLMSYASLRWLCSLVGILPELAFEGHLVEGVLKRVGCFMGLPASWSLLEVQVFLIAYTVDKTCRFRLKGDDIIAYWNRSQCAMFTFLAKGVGLIVNDKTIIAKYFGTFAECDYRLVRRKKGYILKRMPTFSLRVFTEGNIPDRKFWHSAVSRGVSANLLTRLTHFSCQKWIIPARRYRVPLYDPIQAGGLGLPCDEKSQDVSRGCLCVMQAINNGAPLCLVPETPPSKEGWTPIVTREYEDIPWVYCKGEPYLGKEFDQKYGRDLAGALWTDACENKLPPPKRELRPKEAIRCKARYRSKLKRLPLNVAGLKSTVEEANNFFSCCHPDPDELGAM